MSTAPDRPPTKPVPSSAAPQPNPDGSPQFSPPNRGLPTSPSGATNRPSSSSQHGSLSQRLSLLAVGPAEGPARSQLSSAMNTTASSNVSSGVQHPTGRSPGRNTGVRADFLLSFQSRTRHEQHRGQGSSRGGGRGGGRGQGTGAARRAARPAAYDRVKFLQVGLVSPWGWSHRWCCEGRARSVEGAGQGRPARPITNVDACLPACRPTSGSWCPMLWM